MAKQLQIQVAGGSVLCDRTANTVADAAKQVGAEGYQATVNGETANACQTLNDRDFVTFSKPVKAG